MRDHISLIKHPLLGNSRTDVNVKRGASKGFRYEKLAIVERGSFIGENGWQGRGVMDFSCSLAFFLAFHPFFVRCNGDAVSAAKQPPLLSRLVHTTAWIMCLIYPANLVSYLKLNNHCLNATTVNRCV